MKVKVIQDKCIGCGACVAIAPLNFDFDEKGLSTVIDEEVTDKTVEAKDACPVYAIEIEEVKETAKKSATCECEESTCSSNCGCGNDCKGTDDSNEEEDLQEAA